MAEESHPEQVEGFTQANAAGKRPVYEVGFHLVPSLDETGAAKVVEDIRNHLGDAELISEGPLTKMTLAYPIERAEPGHRDKYSESYFGWVKFSMERENIPALEVALRAMRDVVRFILIETVREDYTQQKRRGVFTSGRLEGQTLQKPTATQEEGGEVSQEQLDKSIDELTK